MYVCMFVCLYVCMYVCMYACMHACMHACIHVLVNYKGMQSSIDQFRYIKIQPNTIDFSMRLWGINPTNSVVIPQSLVLRSIVLG